MARREKSGRATLDAAGIGDATFGAKAWIFRGPTESGGNVSFGVSLKVPTGASNTDPSIAPSDGGWGIALESTGYQRTLFQSLLYFSGTYLFNPVNTNGAIVKSNQVSVVDQYLCRAGISRPVPKIRTLIATIGGRVEGVPVRDAFSKSDGFRRPGYVISVDPGLVYSYGHNTFSLNVPVAAERNFRRGVLDIANHTHGDGAFADYVLTVSYTRHF